MYPGLLSVPGLLGSLFLTTNSGTIYAYGYPYPYPFIRVTYPYPDIKICYPYWGIRVLARIHVFRSIIRILSSYMQSYTDVWILITDSLSLRNTNEKNRGMKWISHCVIKKTPGKFSLDASTDFLVCFATPERITH